MRSHKSIIVTITFFIAALTLVEFSSMTTSAQTDRFVAAANKLVTAINIGDTDGVINEFAENVKQAFPPDKAKAYFQNLVAQHGKILRLEAPRSISPQQASFLIHFEKADLEMKLYLDDQNKIIGFGFSPVAATTPVPQKTEQPTVTVKPTQDPPNSADELFRTGKFPEAEKAYLKLANKDKKNYQAALRLGHIALLGNRFDAARKWLAIAAQINAEEKTSFSLLAENAYRQDDFSTAAVHFAKAGRVTKAKQIESFKGQTPYKIRGSADMTRLKFVQTDPLPLVQVKVNSSETVFFLIDTGGGETILDKDFAKDVGATIYASEMGTFGGNTQAETGLGRVDSLMLGDWTIENVPIATLNTKPFDVAANGKKVSGIIGTNLLYHFISTIDYQNGELVLQKKSKNILNNLYKQKQMAVPFWLAGDHLIVAWGTANQSQPMLMLVDTGLAGGGFVCPQSTLDEIGVKLSGKGGEGTFGGGKAKITPFMINELTLGDARAQNIAAIFGAFPTKLEYGQGFRIGGLISHTFFRDFAVTFDFSKMLILLSQSNRQQ